MSKRFVVRRGPDTPWTGPEEWAADVAGFRRQPMADEESGAVHTGFAVCELQGGYSLPAHVHSFEESGFVLDGELVADTSEGSFLLVPGDYWVLNVGTPHALRNMSGSVSRWAQMQAPAPRSRTGWDTYVVPPLSTTEPIAIDVRDPRTRSLGHIDPANMEITKQSQQNLAASASMRTALLVYSGVTVKMMVDTDLGAELSTMFMVQYDPEGVAGPHDHPFEETYLFLEGQAEATFDGERFVLGPGDAAWAGVGCIHSFTNLGAGPLRWLETQAPQPPRRHSYRFARDWNYLQDLLGSDRRTP